MQFWVWFMSQIPVFLMAEPISSFVGIALLCYLTTLFGRIKRL